MWSRNEWGEKLGTDRQSATRIFNTGKDEKRNRMFPTESKTMSDIALRIAADGHDVTTATFKKNKKINVCNPPPSNTPVTAEETTSAKMYLVEFKKTEDPSPRIPFT